ncbi:response regulator [Clostridium sp. JNZ X4-2]
MGKIVLAEDQPITRMDIYEMLTSSGYDVVGKASDGLQAVDLCRRCRPDLAIMDIKMSKLDGIQAAQLIIKEELAEAVVMLTAYSGKEFIN